ncbi:acylglycerol kinase, mitochondrial [Protopterus annectens]|uniref:acylglycerol kinase, mitochondrial n=1 Tax=Protopterus annectens TaxID=7888 RepID=UPI001CFB5A9B|nr:acylglycerol kinase, mitochondrial [Protopterus annectens]
MAKVVKIFRTVRNHWKKTTVGVCLLTWSGHWLYGRHCDDLLRRAACEEAKVFGDQVIPPTVQAKKATVFLNPAACKGKARSLFEKNAAPILHLAGIDATIVKTDYEGQAKKLLDLMENTDMIIVAGGDGTLQEVITGLLRRKDETTFSKIPIGFIPLGATSSLSRTLYPENKDKVKTITNAALAILKGETVQLDVLQIKSEKEQPVFAMSELRWGSYRDASVKASKYWYFGPLKTRAAHLFSSLKEWPQRHQAALSYLGPTDRPPEEPEVVPSRPPLYMRILRRFTLYWSPPKEEIQPVDVPAEAWEELSMSAIELSISTSNQQPDLKRTEDSMNIRIEPDTVTRGEFISLGSQKVKDPKVIPEGYQLLQGSRCKLQLSEGTTGFFGIDNEEYEAMNVEVNLLPRKLRFFCDAGRKQELLQ